MVVNGENAAGGVGITEKTARELLDAGVDAITLGNHAYRHQDVYELPRQRRARSCARPTTRGRPRPRATGGGEATACAWAW